MMLSDPGDYTLGVGGLEKLVGRVRSPYVILILGHPGSGKTSLASTICYRNTLEGRRCLYVSFYEDKDKLFNYMRDLGLNLASVESVGLLRFARLPTPTKVDSVVDLLNTLLSEGKYDVVVIDSINPVLAGAEDPEKRAWLLNYFYNLAHLNNRLVVLVEELPYGQEATKIEEFASDAVLVLRSEVEEGFLLRKLEVRKVRGRNIPLAEVPFSIVENRGFEVFVPPVLEEVPVEAGEIYVPCRAFRQVWGTLKRGFIVGVYYPAIAGPRDLLIFLLAMLAINNVRALFLSYRYSPNAMIEMTLERAEELGIEQAITEKILSERITFASINPFSRSVTQLAIDELQLIDSVGPDLVVFHGIEILREGIPSERYLKERYNQLNYLKSRGILVIRVGEYVDENAYKEMALLDDAVIKLSYVTPPSSYGTLKYEALLWRRGKLATIVSPEEVDECVRECVEILKQKR